MRGATVDRASLCGDLRGTSQRAQHRHCVQCSVYMLCECEPSYVIIVLIRSSGASECGARAAHVWQDKLRRSQTQRQDLRPVCEYVTFTNTSQQSPPCKCVGQSNCGVLVSMRIVKICIRFVLSVGVAACSHSRRRRRRMSDVCDV